MMKKVRIDHSGHPMYAVFMKLYEASFPLFEQRTKK